MSFLVRKASALKGISPSPLVKDYLLDFNDQHIYFIDRQTKQDTYRGFTVRRYEENLYVTRVDQEENIKVGMKFTALGGYSIAELKEIHKRHLNVHNSELENWNEILAFYDVAQTEDTTIPLHFYPRPSYIPVHQMKQLSQDTVLITMTDFYNPDSIVKMMEENQTLLETSEHFDH